MICYSLFFTTHMHYFAFKYIIFTSFKMAHPSTLVSYLWSLLSSSDLVKRIILRYLQILPHCCSLNFLTLINILWTPGPRMLSWSTLPLTFCYNEDWQYICIFFIFEKFCFILCLIPKWLSLWLRWEAKLVSWEEHCSCHIHSATLTRLRAGYLHKYS